MQTDTAPEEKRLPREMRKRLRQRQYQPLVLLALPLSRTEKMLYAAQSFVRKTLAQVLHPAT